jgi:hypothetical protein
VDDVTLEAPQSRPFEAIQRDRFARRIRTSMHDAVEGALAEMVGSTDTRSALRAAGLAVADALAAHVDASPTPRAIVAARASADDTACTRARDARAGRARAFRRMAGVR